MSALDVALQSGLTSRIYYTQLDGFDTHAGQLSTHTFLLRELDEALKAFVEDLHQAGEGKRVVVLVFSEFGRRAHENGSKGTDHGAAAPMFVLGGKVKAGIYGKMPSLADLDDGDLKYTTDFRRVYAKRLAV